MRHIANAKKLPSGSWRVNLFIGYDANHKRIYKSFTATDKREAEYMASEYAARRKEDRIPENITVSTAIDRYIESKSNILSPSTIAGYQTIKRNSMQSLLGVKLRNVTQSMLQRAVNEESARLSPKSVRNAYGLIISAIRYSIPRFAVEVTLPAAHKKLNELPGPDVIIAAVRGSSIELPALLAIWLGLRMSEVRGLQYRDVVKGNLLIRRVMLTVDNAHVTREQTKTYDSTRKLRLPPYLFELIGNGDPTEYIVKDSGQAIYKRFVRLLESKDIEPIRFHDLRHLNASVMLALGVPDKYAMDRGGWASERTLKNIYQQTFTDRREAVDNAIDDYFNGIVDSTMQHDMQHESE